jgi:hypothetical protein
MDLKIFLARILDTKLEHIFLYGIINKNTLFQLSATCDVLHARDKGLSPTTLQIKKITAKFIKSVNGTSTRLHGVANTFPDCSL